MAPRQVWLFQLGCWVSLAAALLHLLAHVTQSGTVGVHAAMGLSLLKPSFVFLVPGLRQPTYAGVLSGLSLSLAVFLATLGMAGLAVLKHRAEAPRVLRGLARAFALGSAALLLISIAFFFSLQTFPIAVMVMCFALAAVTPDGA